MEGAYRDVCRAVGAPAVSWLCPEPIRVLTGLTRRSGPRDQRGASVPGEQEPPGRPSRAEEPRTERESRMSTRASA
ncbi:hypothetical protein GCM10009759_17840 [Kitasatospora saccharophila]|uniref:Uncharacterized protein n=1 Tax=Kitasatospora saccharophila TaxID=407973 RepID=A0ABP5I4J7_9ACTN